MLEAIINRLSGTENGGMGKNEHSSSFSFGNMVILPILGGLGPILALPGPNFGVTDNWGCLKLL